MKLFLVTAYHICGTTKPLFSGILVYLLCKLMYNSCIWFEEENYLNTYYSILPNPPYFENAKLRSHVVPRTCTSLALHHIARSCHGSDWAGRGSDKM